MSSTPVLLGSRRTTGFRKAVALAPESLCVPGVGPSPAVYRSDPEHVIHVWAGWDKEPMELRVELPRPRRGYGRVRFMSDDGLGAMRRFEG